MDPDISVANLSAAKITVTEFSTTANITTAKLGVTGDVFCNTLVVSGNLNLIQDNLGVSGSVSIGQDLLVQGNQVVWGNLGVTGDVDIQGNQVVWGNLGVTGDVDIQGNSNVDGTLDVGGLLTALDDVEVVGDLLVKGNLGVSGYTDSIVSHVPTAANDSFVKQALSTLLYAQANTLNPGQTGLEIVLPNFQIISGNANTGDQDYSSAGVTESGGTAAPTQEEYVRMASMGKCVGGLIAAKVFEERIVDIDDPLYLYLGETGTTGAPGGNGWWAKENCQVITFTPDPMGTESSYDVYSAVLGPGITGTWGLTGCDYDITLRHCLQFTAGLPYQFFNVGIGFLSQVAYNPKNNRTICRNGYNMTGVTGTYRYWADGVAFNPEFSNGVTGWEALGNTGSLLDYAYKSIRNSLWSYTLGDQGPSGITGTVLTNQPGYAAEYGNGIDIFCVAIHKAIQQKNTTAFGYFSIAASLNFTGPTGQSLIVLACDTAVFTKSTMAQGITNITGELAGPYFGAGGGTAGVAAMYSVFYSSLVVNDVIDYLNDRILVPIGATSLFYGVGQSVIPGDYSGNVLDMSNIGWTGFNEMLEPIGGPNLIWGSDPTAGNYLIDGGQTIGVGLATALGYTAYSAEWLAVVQSNTWTCARIKQYDYGVLELPYDSTIEYKGWLGATMLGKFKDFGKILKLMCLKGVWNGQRIIGRCAMEFILNGSVPASTQYKMRFVDPAFTEWDPYNPYPSPLNAISPYNVGAADKTWAYGFAVGDDLNVDNTSTMMKFPGSGKIATWNGAFGTFWIIDTESGVYATGGDQQYGFSDYNRAVSQRVPYVTPPVNGPSSDPGMLFLNYYSGYKPIAF